MLAALAVAILAAGYCHDARADGLPKSGVVPIGEVAKTASWTGCYVGGAVGYGWTRTEFETQWDGGKAINADDVLASIGGGCDAQIGTGAVVGIMGDLTWSNLKTAWENKSTLDAEWQWFIGARAGFLLTPRTLVYGLVGYTETIDGELTFAAWDKTSLGALKGLTYGGGVEYAAGGGWTGKFEYRYVQYGSHTAPVGEIDGLKDGTDIDAGSHQIRLGLSYRFGSAK